MQNREPVIANYKIITFVVFVCAALITSLFVYHLSQQESSTTSADGNVFIMPAGRDIKNVQLVSANGDTFNDFSFRNHWTLLFFGFTNCSSVCPVTLKMMSKAYPALHTAIPDLQVVLVSLDPERDTKSALKKYTRSFQPDFIGVSGKMEEVRKLQSQLGIYSAKDEAASSQNNYQLQHSADIMLVNPEGKWVGIMKYGMQEKAFTDAVIHSVKKLNKRLA